jgi:hypothetical protein
MATKAQALKVAKEFGFIIEDDGMALTWDCPVGFVSGATGCHYNTIDLQQSREWGELKADIWSDLIVDMRYGMNQCPGDSTCETGECPEVLK